MTDGSQGKSCAASRLADMANPLAPTEVMGVGAATETEMKEKKARVEDTVRAMNLRQW